MRATKLWNTAGRAFALATITALLAGAAGCGGGGGGGGGAGGSGAAGISGHVTFQGASANRTALARIASDAIVEREPNGTIDTATDLGDLAPGTHRAVAGRIVAGDSSDPIDGFRILCPDRVRITATVEATDAGAEADFDLAVYDPASLQVVATFAVDGPVETASFVARGSVELLVTAAAGEATTA